MCEVGGGRTGYRGDPPTPESEALKAAPEISFDENGNMNAVCGASDDANNCFGFDVYQRVPCGSGSWPAPAPPPPPGFMESTGFILFPAVGGVVGAIALVLCLWLTLRRIRTMRRQRANRLSEAALKIQSEYNFSVKCAVDSLPTRTWKEGGGSSSGFMGIEMGSAPMYGGDECAICLNKFAPGDVLRELPCGHTFKKQCIDDWLNTKGRPKPTGDAVVDGLASCPICKKCPIEVPDAPELSSTKAKQRARANAAVSP